MVKAKDFVFTIGDDDNVKDLDSEKDIDMNPDFTFDAGDEFSASTSTGWDFDIGTSTKSVSDPLDEIIKKHGGLANENENRDIEMGDDDDDEDDEEEEIEEDEDNEDSDDIENKLTKTAGEDTAVESNVANDKSGFFEDAQVDTTVHESFANLSLSRPIKKGIAALGYAKPTPIQGSVIPIALLGKDVVAGAVTGSGKTAAYMIPTLERLLYRSQKTATTRVVILTPTRELALQVHDVGKKLGSFVSNLRFGLSVGGLNLRAQEQELKTRPDIVVATPGRFIDHVRNSPSFSVDTVEILILDEADRMLEEGFENELNEILSLIPTKRQTMLFSATMNSNIKDLIKLSLHKPVRIMINPPKQAASGLSQEFVRLRKHEDSRPAVLASLLRKLNRNQRVIVFVARKQTAHRLRVIIGMLGIRVAELHGSLTQEQRVESINAFKTLEVPILVCTDLASRGLDIPKIEVVINYELPNTYEVYLHRVGRTARAGRSGTSISLVGDSNGERQIVRAAIQAANTQEKTSARKQTILGRNIDWAEVDSIKTEIANGQTTVDEILAEEKAAKELEVAEREMLRAENLMAHKNEIQSRPKRTWFESGNAKKLAQKPKSNHQKKKMDAGKQSWGYKKTKTDRSLNTKRGARRTIMKSGARAAKSKLK